MLDFFPEASGSELGVTEYILSVVTGTDLKTVLDG